MGTQRRIDDRKENTRVQSHFFRKFFHGQLGNIAEVTDVTKRHSYMGISQGRMQVFRPVGKSEERHNTCDCHLLNCETWKPGRRVAHVCRLQLVPCACQMVLRRVHYFNLSAVLCVAPWHAACVKFGHEHFELDVRNEFSSPL